MDVDYLLTSTRAVRKGLDLDAPVDRDEIRECLRIGCQASNGSNEQCWRWITITDEATRQEIGRIYKAIFAEMTGMDPEADAFAGATDPVSRMYASVGWTVRNLARVPVHVIPCYKPNMGTDGNAFQLATYYGSIFPAAWNFMLALHSRGYGSCITTLHLHREAEFRALLGIPDDYMQGCLIPVGRLPAGKTFSPAPRKPIEEVAVLDRFDGEPV